jgi:hypothetical protein
MRPAAVDATRRESGAAMSTATATKTPAQKQAMRQRWEAMQDGKPRPRLASQQAVDHARAQIQEFSAALYEAADIVEIRRLKDGEQPRNTFHDAGELAALAESLAEDNAEGWNIHISVNPRKGHGERGDDGVLLARCVFADFDHMIAAEAHTRWRAAGLPEPTFTVESGHGAHIYELLEDPTGDLQAWRNLQLDLADLLKSDGQATNPERLMRLPGFNNVKAEPVPCQIVNANPAGRISFAELRAIVPQIDRTPKAAPATTSAKATAGKDNRVERCRKYLAKMPPAIAGQNGHAQTFQAACETQRFGLSEADALAELHIYNQRCAPPWSDAELLHKLQDARAEARGEFGSKLAEPAQQVRTASPKPPAAPEAAQQPKPSILIPGAHKTREGEYLEIGIHDFTNAMLASIEPGSMYRRAQVPGNMVGEPGAKEFRALTNERGRALIDRAMRLTKWVTKRQSQGEEQVQVYITANRDHAALLNDGAATDERLAELRILTPYPLFDAAFELSPGGYRQGVFYDEPPALEGLTPEIEPEVIAQVMDDLLIDFPWANEASRQNYIGLMLTLLVRHAIGGNVPFHLILASLERTGKTKLVEEGIGGAILGRKTPAMQLGKDDSENDKRITSVLMRGDNVLHLDNIRDFIDSPALASLFTSSTYYGRILGISRMVALPNNLTLIGTANNPRGTGEIVKRTVPIQLQPATDAPELRRDFKHPDFYQYASQHRRLILGCLIGMVELWKRNGRPAGKKPMGGFESWARCIGGIMAVAGFSEWMDNAKAWRMESDPRGNDLRALVDEWAEHYGQQSVDANTLLSIARRLELFPDIIAGKNEKAAQTNTQPDSKQRQRVKDWSACDSRI